MGTQTNVSEELHNLTEKKCLEKKIDYISALNEVLEENEDLARQYSEGAGGKITFGKRLTEQSEIHFDHNVKKYMSQFGVDYQGAVKMIFAENPEVAKVYASTPLQRDMGE